MGIFGNLYMHACPIQTTSLKYILIYQYTKTGCFNLHWANCSTSLTQILLRPTWLSSYFLNCFIVNLCYLKVERFTFKLIGLSDNYRGVILLNLSFCHRGHYAILIECPLSGEKVNCVANGNDSSFLHFPPSKRKQSRGYLFCGYCLPLGNINVDSDYMTTVKRNGRITQLFIQLEAACSCFFIKLNSLYSRKTASFLKPPASFPPQNENCLYLNSVGPKKPNNIPVQ